ncbi:ATP-dependent RNA helicase RhlE [Pedobacter sp. UYEF25]
MNFSDFNFNPDLYEGLMAMGYKSATPIQELAIPEVLAHHDLIACAQTGTGKTAGYLLPVMDNISKAKNRHNNTLILAPTRELAQQIDLQVEALSYFTNISSLTVYGGGDGIAYEQQKRSMREGVDIIIATPGRLMSHLSSGVLNLSQLQHLVLDEADRMLDMGFYDDIIRIISYLPQDRQTLLFSATMAPKIRGMATKILKDPKQITISIAKPAAGIDQRAYNIHDQQKQALLTEIFRSGLYKSSIVFASTKEKVKGLYKTFKSLGIKAAAFHSDLEQKEREQILLDFKNRKLPILIGTDVLSRGIDVEGIDLIINYDVPGDPADYVHRVGRTARAETKGTAITLVNAKDKRRFENIEKLIEKQVPRIPLSEEIAKMEIKHVEEKRHAAGRPNKRVWTKNKPKANKPE